MHYVYGVVPGTTVSAAAPAGIDDAPVDREAEGDLEALCSTLSAADYAPAEIERHSGSVDWVSPRAVAHDRVLTWASEHGPVIPFPMFSALFSSAAAVRAMLRERAVELDTALRRIGDAREYALRVYRVDAELRAALPELSDVARALADEAARATPGQRYLLERKAEERTRDELRDVSRRLAAEIRDALAMEAEASVASAISRPSTDSPGIMILNAAFLVRPSALDALQRTLTDLIDRYHPRGLRFDFTGPWPPYHFAGAAGGSTDE
jgi:hypothetical protein